MELVGSSMTRIRQLKEMALTISTICCWAMPRSTPGSPPRSPVRSGPACAGRPEPSFRGLPQTWWWVPAPENVLRQRHVGTSTSSWWMMRSRWPGGVDIGYGYLLPVDADLSFFGPINTAGTLMRVDLPAPFSRRGHGSHRHATGNLLLRASGRRGRPC